MQSKVQSILLGGIAVGLIASLLSIAPVLTGQSSSSPLGIAAGCLACLAYGGAGLLAVWHYTNTYELTIPGGKGAGMGAAAGFVAAAVSTTMTQLAMAVGLTPSMEDQVRASMEANPNADPAQIEQMTQMFSSPGFMVGAVVVGLVLAAVMGVVGGAIGASVFKKGGDLREEGFGAA